MYLAELKASRKAAGVDDIRIPRERSHRAKEKAKRDGITLLTSIWNNTVKIAGELGVAPPRLSSHQSV
jgi:LDH2 family malate/lactate/ureidoglycolate dehydrogenase